MIWSDRERRVELSAWSAGVVAAIHADFKRVIVSEMFDAVLVCAACWMVCAAFEMLGW